MVPICTFHSTVGGADEKEFTASDIWRRAADLIIVLLLCSARPFPHGKEREKVVNHRTGSWHTAASLNGGRVHHEKKVRRREEPFTIPRFLVVLSWHTGAQIISGITTHRSLIKLYWNGYPEVSIVHMNKVIFAEWWVSYGSNVL